MNKRPRELTPKQERFCREYLVDYNATQAAIRAGYSPRNADKAGPRLVGKSRVVARIDELLAPVLKELDIAKEKVLREVALIAFSRLDRVIDVTERGVQPIPWDRVSEDDLAAVAEASQTLSESGGSIRVRMHDKLKALERLGEYLGLWKGDALPAGLVEIHVNLVPAPESPEVASQERLGPGS